MKVCYECIWSQAYLYLPTVAGSKDRHVWCSKYRDDIAENEDVLECEGLELIKEIGNPCSSF